LKQNPQEDALEITDIKCYVMASVAQPASYRWRTGIPLGDGTPIGDTQHSAILKIETDEGIVGVAHGRRGYRVADVVKRRLKYLVGEDPLMTERLWELVWEIDRIEEIQIHDLGLLDQACWDTKSQKASMPLYQLLGGYEAKVPAYASTVTWDTMDEYERYIKMCMDEGFTAFKLHAWGDAKEDAKLSHNLRKWTGPDADLMFDGSAGWDYVTSMTFGRELEAAGFLWYEEPMREFDLVSYTELSRALDIPILAAETCDGVHWNAATWIQTRALDMVRTSAAFKGGMTGAMKVAHLAESFGMRAEVHGGGYANLHLCAAIPNNTYFEALVIDEKQIKGLKDQGDLAVIDGHITAPSTPGLQPQPDWAKVEAEAVLVV
jgi:L-alanine-DL-glutamate epimerase-like enolase superfamily enzyme